MLKTEFSELNKTRDIVLIDQRGTGGSNLLMCPKPDKPFDVTDAAALSAYAKSCLKVWMPIRAGIPHARTWTM